jgi:hypothetical protein
MSERGKDDLPAAVIVAVRRAVSCLVDRKYVELEILTHGARWPAVEMARAIVEYGRTLREPPLALFDDMDVVDVTAAHVKPGSRKWSIRVPLWTVEEGRSDLSLELSVTVTTGGSVEIELDDIHVF